MYVSVLCLCVLAITAPHSNAKSQPQLKVRHPVFISSTLNVCVKTPTFKVLDSSRVGQAFVRTADTRD